MWRIIEPVGEGGRKKYSALHLTSHIAKCVCIFLIYREPASVLPRIRRNAGMMYIVGMKKRKYRSCREERRVELLKEYYEFDEERKTFDIVLHFETASDLFNERFDLIKHRVMKEEVVSQVADMLGDIPKGYKADISIVVDDYQDVPYQEILDAFHNALEIRFARSKGGDMRKYHKVAILTLVGTFLVSLMITGEIMGWWGIETAQGRLLSYLLDTAGCVLLWEGLYAALLDRTPDATLGFMLSKRLASIGLYRNDGTDRALISEDQCDVILRNSGTGRKKIGSMLLFVSGFILVGAGLIGALLRLPAFAQQIREGWGSILVLSVVEVLSSLFLGGLGFLAIRMFNEDYRLYILNAILTGIVGVFAIISVASLSFGHMTPTSAVVSILTLTVMILYVVGFILFSRQHWADIKRTIRRKE